LAGEPAFLLMVSRLADGHFCDLAVAGAEAERVGQPARDDRIGHPDIDDMRRVGLGGFLRGGERNRRGVTGNDAVNAGLGHLGDFGSADVGLALAVGQHRLDHGAAHRLDAAGGVDVGNRHFSAGAALRTGKSDEARNRMDQADLDRRGLRPQDRWKSGDANAKGCGAGCKEFAAANPCGLGFRCLRISHHSPPVLSTGGRFSVPRLCLIQRRRPGPVTRSWVAHRMPSLSRTRFMDISKR
jgi:hypothetical protein